VYELVDVSKTFRQGSQTIHAVDGVSLRIDEGDFVVIVGASGSGKSTLLQLLGGLDRPTSGHAFFEGDDLAALADRRLAEFRSKAFGFVFQHFNLIPTLTAAENIESAMAPTGAKRGARRARAAALLEQVGLAGRAGHLPSQLSGGEQQRVAIARALANAPRVLLADEPTGNLDTTTGATILDLLSSLWREHGQTIVLVTHDARVTERASRLMTMLDGRLTEQAAVQQQLA
jgi:putative ABC transport system ATP-binding protein